MLSDVEFDRICFEDSETFFLDTRHAHTLGKPFGKVQAERKLSVGAPLPLGNVPKELRAKGPRD